MRCPEFSEIFRKAGFIPLIEKDRLDPEALKAIENCSIELHADFKNFSHEELAADYMWYTGQKPVPTDSSNPPEQTEENPLLENR